MSSYNKKNFLNDIKNSLLSSVGLQNKSMSLSIELDVYNNYYENISKLDNVIPITDSRVEDKMLKLSDIRASKPSISQITKARSELESAIDLCITLNYSNTKTAVGAIISLLNRIVSNNRNFRGFNNIIPIVDRYSYEENLIEIKRVITILESQINPYKR